MLKLINVDFFHRISKFIVLCGNLKVDEIKKKIIMVMNSMASSHPKLTEPRLINLYWMYVISNSIKLKLINAIGITLSFVISPGIPEDKPVIIQITLMDS